MVTPIFRTIYLVCQDIECGCTFAGGLEITHVISPSALDRPRVALPFRPTMRGQPASIPAGVAAGIVGSSANDDMIEPAASTGG